MKNLSRYDESLSVPRKKDVIEKQDKITARGILKGDGAGGVSTAVPGMDYLGVDDEIQGLRLRGGINSIINNVSAVSINPAVNAVGFLRYNGGNVQIFYDGILMPFQNWEIDILFDGKSGTNLNFGRGPSNAQTACLWSETTNYPQNARVMYQTTSGVFRWYKAMKESKGVTPEGDSTGAWEDASSSWSPSMMDVRNLEVSIVIDSNLVLKWENGASFYWRAAKQNCRYYKIEIYDSITNQYVLVAERDNIPIDEVVNTQYMGTSVDGVGKRVRITFRAQSNEDTGWFAVTQIAFTGIIGGIEGTLLNRGGGTMYGNLSPYTAGGASLGTSLARWNEVHANKFYGNGSNLTNIPYPVTSVNGATGATKSTFYVTVMPTGSGYAATADKTTAEVYAAYVAGYAVYAIVNFPGINAPLELPLVAAASTSDTIVLGFGALGSLDPTASPQYPTVVYTGTAWMAWLGTLAKKSDIPTVPTALKNPYSLDIKIGNETTSYDGSAAKTVEIPKGVPLVTAADNGKILRVINGDWKAGDADISLGITGATTEQFPKIKAVDATGKPTAWEVVEGEEVTLGGDVPAPTDAQVNTAVNTWLTEHPEATTTVQDGSVSVEKLGYGKHIYGSKPYFCNSVGSGAASFGSIGVVVPCKAGDTIYCTFNMSTSGAYQKPQLLAALPENQYGAIAPIGTIEKDDTTKAYTVPESATTTKAMYLPQNFVGIPAANNGSVEDALAWINKTIGTDGKWCAQNVPFTELDAWYQTAQTELFDIDESCNKLMYASLYQAVSKLVGAKVAVLGDSLTEQSACSFITSAYNDRWMENVLRDTALTGDDGKTYKGSGWFALIARKYKIKWWCAGHGEQWWYSTTARPNGATAMVRKLIDGTDEFDYIVLEYGTNDILSGYTHIGTAADEASETATTSCGAIKWCIEQLQTRFPEASIVVILPNIRSGANGEAPATQQAYLDAVVPILKKYSVRYVNMAEDSGIVKSMMSTDGVHLRWPVVRGGVTYYTNDTTAVRKFSKCLESVLLQA